jgi:modulator of FtsH protease HflK
MSERGGPWGSGRGGGRGGGPWGGGGGRGNGGGGDGGDDSRPPPPRGPGPRPPDFEEMLRRSQDRFRQLLPGGRGAGSLIVIGIVVVVVLWLASGFYRVQPDELGVVLRFGAFDRMTQPGLNYHLPAPIESALTPSVTRQNRMEIGYRTGEVTTARSRSGQVPEEALMLTGDENIVDINFTVLWVVKDAKSYLFNIRNPEGTVKSAAESAMREISGETPIAQALAEGRGKIESDTQRLLQSILDSYGAGIEITLVQLQKVDPPNPVIESFRDVQRALADRERLRNEAESYRNDIIPRARGNAVRITQEGEAYRQAIIARSTGDADRFVAVYRAFRAVPDVTTERLYLETMEEVLKNSSKVIIDTSAMGGSGVLPYLPLPALGSGNAGAAPATGSTAEPGSSGGGAQPLAPDAGTPAPPLRSGQN